MSYELIANGSWLIAASLRQPHPDGVHMGAAGHHAGPAAVAFLWVYLCLELFARRVWFHLDGSEEARLDAVLAAVADCLVHLCPEMALR